jgi:hypothetical protein
MDGNRPVETPPSINENATQATGTAGRLFAGQALPRSKATVKATKVAFPG